MIPAVERQVDAERSLLGCALTFATGFPDADEPPYEVIARFRIVYRLLDDELPEGSDCEQFVYWNTVFNAWPDWREYLSNTIHRTQLPNVLDTLVEVNDTTIEVLSTKGHRWSLTFLALTGARARGRYPSWPTEARETHERRPESQPASKAPPERHCHLDAQHRRKGHRFPAQRK